MALAPGGISSGEVVSVLGRTVPGDGGFGLFRFDPSSSGATTNGIDVVRAAGGVWRRLWDGHTINAAWVGCIADSTSEQTGTDNGPIVQAVINRYPSFELVFPPSGASAYRFSTSVTIPNATAVRIVGKEAKLAFYAPSSEASLFFIANGGSSTDAYKRKEFIDLSVYLYGERAHAVKADSNSATGEYSVNRFRIMGCSFIGGVYPVWMRTAYSIAPEISDCSFQSNGAIWWEGCGTGSTPVHASSNAVILNNRCQGSVAGSDDGLVYLSGMKSARIASLILEGTHNQTLEAGKCYGLRIANPGPYYTTVENLWVEFWGEKQPGVRSISITSECDGPDYGVFVRLSAIAGVRDLYVRNAVAVKGGIIIVSGSNVTSDDLAGWTLDDLTTTAIVDGAKISRSLPSRRFSVRGEVVSNGVGYNNLRAGSDTNTIARYNGGTISQVGSPVTHSGPNVGVRYVQWVPGAGACVAVRKNANGLSLSENASPAAGWFSRFTSTDKAGFWCRYLLPHANAGASGKEFVAHVGSAKDSGIRIPASTIWEDVVGCTPSPAAGPVFGVTPYSTWALEEIPEWLVVAAWSVGMNCIPDAQSSGDTFDCYEDPAYPGIPTGTVIKGSVCRKQGDPVIDRYVCTKSGTSRQIALTANTSSGSAVITSVSQILDLIPGDHVSVGPLECFVVSVNTNAASAVVSATIQATASGVAVLNRPPEWITVRHYT